MSKCKNKPQWKSKLSNLSQKLLISLKIKRMTFNSKSLLFLRTTLSIWVQSSLGHRYLNQPMSFLTLDQNILPSLVAFAMMRHQDNTDSRNLTHHLKLSLREIKNLRDARLWLMTCKSLTLKRFFPKPHQSSLTDLLSFKASSGKIILASNLLTLRRKAESTLNCSLLKTNALYSNS